MRQFLIGRPPLVRWATGEGEEDVVQVGGHGQVARPPRRRRRRCGPAGRAARHAAVARHLQDQCVVVAAAPGQHLAGRVERLRRRRTAAGCARRAPAASAAPACPGQRSGRGPGRRSVGELVGLLQVLRGEQDRDAAGDQLADELPHARRLRGSRPVVGSSRKMIRGSPTSVIARSSRRCMPPEYVTARLAGGVRQVEPLEQCVGPAAPSARPRWCRSAIRRRFSRPVSSPSTAENWPVTPIAARTSSGRVHVVAGHPDLAGVGGDQRGQDLDGGGLAGAVRAEQGEDGAFGNRSGRCRRARVCSPYDLRRPRTRSLDWCRGAGRVNLPRWLGSGEEIRAR